MKEANKKSEKKDARAWFWAITLMVLCLTGLSTTWIDLGHFWNGYVLDMTGPAWTYILFRGLFTNVSHNRWTRFFKPVRTVALLLAACFSIEAMQYFEVYDSTFDNWDLVAYCSLIIPLFFLDYYQQKGN